jgi:hypothetical protein
MPRRVGRVVALLSVLVLPALVFVAGIPAGASPDLQPFRGLGTWVDVYDYVPEVQSQGDPPPVSAASVDDMAALGVRTLYLQAAQDDTRIPGSTVERRLLGRFLRRAHDDGLEVVAWYLPQYADLEADLRHIRGLVRFRSGGERFDGIALDLEYTQGVPDPATRNKALVTLVHKARDMVGSRPLGAVVLEPLLLEEVNRQYWPGFPWKKLRSSFDVWLPMSYWTNRDSASGLRDGFRYTKSNIRRLRRRLGDPDLPVHAIGGIADSAETKDYQGFVRAARQSGAIGYSIYDFNTTTSGVWAQLRR